MKSMFKNIGMRELIVVGLILLVLFGSKLLPGLTGRLMTAVKEFRKAFREGSSGSKDKEAK